MLPREAMLDEDTRQLTILVEDVVRPLDLELGLLLVGHIGGIGAHDRPGG